MSDARLIGLDWGTTSCRAYLVGTNGAVLERIADGPGILKVANGAFSAAFDAMTGRWDNRLPVVLSGMIGSRQGWREASYARCPAGADDIVKALATIDHAGRAISLAPGLATENDRMPDVMRGEETQVLGALALSGRDDGLFLLPGTHSKWAEVSAGRIVAFRTFMTGEVFGALKEHTILGRLMRDGAPDAEGFARGVAEGAALGSAGALLNRVFATRTYGLTERMSDAALADYLSGLLIGAEIAEAAGDRRRAVTIIASAALAARYTEALRLAGRESTLAPQDCAAAGHWRIARAAGLC